jgi:hypothetical protein
MPSRNRSVEKKEALGGLYQRWDALDLRGRVNIRQNLVYAGERMVRLADLVCYTIHAVDGYRM